MGLGFGGAFRLEACAGGEESGGVFHAGHVLGEGG